MKNILCLLVLILTVASCKNKSEENDVVVVPKIENKSDFKVTLDLVVKKNDSLQLFYEENEEGSYEEGKSVWVSVIGSNNPQKVVFNVPKDVLPNRIRLDFGQNRNQEPIEVKNLEIDYLDKKFQAVDTLFYQYFIPNDQIDWDRKNAIAKIKKIKENEFYDPSFNERETLKEELKKLYK